MWSGLVHHGFWHMVMKALEEHSGCILIGCQQMEAAFPDLVLGAHLSYYTAS